MKALDISLDWPLFMPLAFALVAAAWILIRMSRGTRSRINLEDLLLGEDGRISNSKFVLLCSWVMATWLIVFLAVSERLTEGYFAAYLGAFVATSVVQAFNSKPEGPAPGARGEHG